MNENKNFLKTILLTIVLVALIIIGFFLNNNEWDTYKIVSCCIVSIWAIFLPASYRYGILEMKAYIKSLGSYQLSILIALYYFELLLVPLVLAPLFFYRYFTNNYKYFNKD